MVACRKSKFQWSFGSVRTTKTHSFQLCLDSFIFVHADFTSRKGAFMKSSLSLFVTAALFSEFGCMFTDSCLCFFLLMSVRLETIARKKILINWSARFSRTPNLLWAPLFECMKCMSSSYGEFDFIRTVLLCTHF